MRCRIRAECFFYSFLIFLACAPAVQAQAIDLVLDNKGQSLRLIMDEAPSQVLQVQKATLTPIDQPVKIASRLIVEASRALDKARFPDVATKHVERLHVYAGRYLYVFKFDSVAAALAAIEPLQKSPEVLLVQPDLLPERHKQPGAMREAYPLVIRRNRFRITEYVPLDRIWQKTRGSGVKVAVIDTGINLTHPALGMVKPVFSWDADVNAPLSTGAQDDFHGTNVAGVIWAQPDQLKPAGLDNLPANVAVGLAPEAELINLRLRYPWTSNVVRAFALAEQHGAQVINISWLLPWVASPLRDYLRYLTLDSRQGKGIVIVVAANPQPVPNLGLAAMPELLVVTSTDHVNQLAHASWDENVDLAVVSYLPTVAFHPPRLYGSFAKTSASAPVMTGLVALFRALRPELTASQLQLLLVSNGVPASALQPDGSVREYKYMDVAKVHQQLFEK